MYRGRMRGKFMSNSSKPSGGVGFCGLLTIVFIGLKLAKFIDWSWLWVLSPLWISAVLIVIMAVGYLIVKNYKNNL